MLNLRIVLVAIWAVCAECTMVLAQAVDTIELDTCSYKVDSREIKICRC